MKTLVFILLIFTSPMYGQNTCPELVKVETRDTIIGDIMISETLYKVHKGSRGGLYIWRKSGKTGQMYKGYLTDKQKAEIRKP